MRGDFARLTFDPKKHYTGVLHQQGRVWLEADWNEDVYNRQHLLQQETRDIIGACGVPEPGTAFMISPNPNPTSQPCDFLIAGGPGPQGRYYVDGILCELEATPFTPIGFPSGSSMQVSAWLVDDREFQVGQWVEISGIAQGNQKTQLVQISAVDPGNCILTFSTDVSVFQRATAPSARHLPTYLSQPDFPNAPAIQWPASGSDLWAVVYLEVWQRFITHLEDEALREIALGGPDTAARLKTVAQVKFLPITKELTCTEARGLLPKKSQAKLSTIQPKDRQPEDLCRLPDPATYTGRENRLYRIEIHNGGDVAGTDPSVELKLPLALDVEKRAPILKLKNALNPQQIDALTRSGVVRLMDDDGHQEIVTIANVSSDTLTLHISPSYRYTIAKNALVIGNIARFKWSRDNASFAVSVKAVSDDRKTLTLSSLGRDQATWLRQLDLVEISDDASELGPAAGHLTELLDTDPDQLTVTLAEPLPSEFLLTKEGHSERHMILRRWDGQGWASAAPDGIELEDGVHIQFGGSDLRPGDYWQFAARSIDGSVEKLDGASPKGVVRHYCPLAIVKWTKQYQFDRQKLIETLTSRRFGSQAISRLENILREQYGESNQIIADISEILSTAQHADLSDTQRQKLHESLLQVKPQVTFTVLEDCRSQFPALTNLTHLFYVSGDGQEVTPDLTNTGEQFLHLRQPLCVGVANWNKPVKDAIVQFKIIGDPFPQGVAKGKLQNDGISVDILTQQNGLAFCDWQLWFDSSQPEDVKHAILSQQVEANLLDNSGNIIALPVRFTANLSVATEMAYGWGLTGNASTDPSMNFLGTTDEKPLVIKTNAKEAVRVDPTGKVGIGITQPDATLHVSCITTNYPQVQPGLHIEGNSPLTPAVLRLTDGGTLGDPIHHTRPGPGTPWDIAAGGDHLYFALPQAENWVVGTIMSLFANGDVGIGRPVKTNARLHISSDGHWDHPQLQIEQTSPESHYARLRFNRADKDTLDQVGKYWDIAVGGDPVGSEAMSFYSEAKNENVMTLTYDGKVGIGTSNPDAKLHITSGDDYNSPQVHIFQTTLNEFARLRFSSTTTEPDGATVSTLPWDIAVGGGVSGQMNFFQQGTGNVMTLNAGNVGIGIESPEAKLHVVGDLKVTGQKQFVQAHPTDPTKEIVYVSLEGGEAGTYMRGTWKLENGKAVIELPEHFSVVTSGDGLTVQLTPRGEWLQLYVVQVDTKQIVVQEAQGKNGQFDYLIQGVRKGYEHQEVIREKK